MHEIADTMPGATTQLPIGAKSRRRSLWLARGGVVALGLALYLPGINWGLPGVVSWSQDTIAGMRTVGAMESWPDHWMGRYPPLQYMLLRAAYEPALAHWRASGQLRANPQTRQLEFAPPHAPKIGALFLIARLISAAMAIGAGLVLLQAVLRAAVTSADSVRARASARVAGVLATCAFMSGAGFTYFAHLGNVDAPAMLWFALSLLFYVRLLTSRRSLDAALLGLFAALTVCTKDAWIGMYPGMALVLLVDEWRKQRVGTRESSASTDSRGGALPATLRAILQPRWLIGIAAFAVPYVIVNGILWNPVAYAERLGGWLSPAEGAWITREHRYDSLSLLVETVRQAAAAVGWPLLAALATAAVFMLIKRRRLAMAMLVPAIGYYLIVIERIDFVYERFLFAPLMMMCLLGGIAGADFINSGRLPAYLRGGVIGLALLPALAYAAAIDLEMVNDSRYAAEDWFRAHVPPGASVGAVSGDLKFFSPQYLPRVHEMGYATFPVLCHAEDFQHPQPEYLILSGFDRQDFDAEAGRCADALMAGRLGYDVAATFGPTYVGADSWLALADWGAPAPGKLSPTITVLRRAKP